jgi:hypothetical protein
MLMSPGTSFEVSARGVNVRAPRAPGNPWFLCRGKGSRRDEVKVPTLYIKPEIRCRPEGRVSCPTCSRLSLFWLSSIGGTTRSIAIAASGADWCAAIEVVGVEIRCNNGSCRTGAFLPAPAPTRQRVMVSCA